MGMRGERRRRRKKRLVSLSHGSVSLMSRVSSCPSGGGGGSGEDTETNGQWLTMEYLIYAKILKDFGLFGHFYNL